MNQRNFWGAAGILALIILVAFLISAPKGEENAITQAPMDSSVIAQTIAVRDVYKKGVHTLSGSLEAPDACSTATAEATASEEGIFLAITVASDPGICLQVPTRRSFSTTVTAPADVPIAATVNGSSVSITSS